MVLMLIDIAHLTIDTQKLQCFCLLMSMYTLQRQTSAAGGSLIAANVCSYISKRIKWGPRSMSVVPRPRDIQHYKYIAYKYTRLVPTQQGSQN